MKALATLTSLALLFPSAWAEKENNVLLGNLIFPEGDSIPGLPASIEQGGILNWKSDLLFEEQTPFQSRAIESIRFSDRLSNENEDITLATLTFHQRVNKMVDVIQGELLGFDEEHIHIKTWYAGELSLKRKMMTKIEISGDSHKVVNGVGRMDQWTKVNDTKAWAIEEKALISNSSGTISREFPNLPKKLKIEFDLTFEYPTLSLHLFANTGTEINPDTGYRISIQRGPMQFYKRVDARRVPLKVEHFGQRFNFVHGEAVKIEIYRDAEDGLLALYINGKVICQATDTTPLLDTHWLHFSTRHEQEHVISDFSISTWNGELPKNLDFLEYRRPLPGEGKRIELQNGDTIIGEATAFEEGKILIKTEYLDVAMPLERLRSFEIPRDSAEEPKLYSEDIRAHFHTGGYVTLKLTDITDTTITGFSQVFGEATFDLLAFSHIVFNLYD